MCEMSSSRHHLLDSPDPSAGGGLLSRSSPSSPMINGGFNCLCINNSPLADSVTKDTEKTSTLKEGLTILKDFTLSERIPSLHLSPPVLETSVAARRELPSTSHSAGHSRKSQSGSFSQLDVSVPTFERFHSDLSRPSYELLEPWEVRLFNREVQASQDSATPEKDGGGISSTSGAFGPLSDPDRSEDKLRSKTRRVYINNPLRTSDSSDIVGNKVRTSKYTIFSFLPKNLFEQFRRIAYIYFLAIIGLNQIPQLAVFGRTASLFPLLFVLIVTAIKDGYEDWGRHRSDVVENNRIAQVFFQGQFRPKKWKWIEVGEVIKVYADCPVPCDMVLLETSDPSGAAFIQTLNLDGESTLKTRFAKQETQVKQPEVNALSGVVVCEAPTRNIYEFEAYMELDNAEIALGASNVILRGCELKNTAWIVGVVVYAGRDTKVMMNSAGAQSKRSKLESQMNRATMWLAFLLLVICFVGGLGMGLWVGRHQSILDTLAYYHELDTSTGTEAVLTFLSFVIMFQVMIPISLYISMELVRLGQSTFMSRDLEMYHRDSDTRFECRALNINEDLGQIKYVFCDKTGTLTENKMEFHTASIHGIDYRDGVAYSSASVPQNLQWKGDCRLRPKEFVNVNLKLLQLTHNSQQTLEKKTAEDFFIVLAVCNTVVPIKVDKEKLGEFEASSALSPGVCQFIEYQAESPDEQALVSAASSYGYVLSERTSKYVNVEVQGELQRFELLGLHEFDSVRKRMSVVVRCPDKSIKLMLKGADTTVLDLVAKPTTSVSNPETEKHLADVLSSTQAHLDQYAREGLRTLVVTSKDLSEDEFQEWSHAYAIANTSLGNRVVLLRAVAESIERDLTLLGATGVEDKLQDGVPETIAALRAAGMRVWVLTGDKQETAISIGFSCSLLTHDMKQIVVSSPTRSGCRDQLVKGKETICLGERQGTEPSEMCNKVGWPMALIIDGQSLVYALEKDLEQELFDLATACQVVICCRVAPSQKANIVSMIKEKTQEMTLAIGDGANDVPMIQKAHVGVGISGQEGRQAVMSSDFSMGQFRFLRKLLLVHGHWNYQRLSYMVLYNFYRNSVFVMMLFWYILHTAFSPSSAVFDWNLMFYSLIYTSVPTIVVGIWDKNIGHKTLLSYPPLYGVGQRGEKYNSRLFWITMLDTLWQSLALFYIPLFTYQESTIDIWSIGSLWTISVVILVNLHLAMDVQRWTWITHLAIWGSIASTFCCLLILDSVKQDAFLSHYWVIYKIIGSYNYWFDILLIVILALLPRFTLKIVVQKFRPSDVQIVREAEIRKKAKIRRQCKSSEAVKSSPEPLTVGR